MYADSKNSGFTVNANTAKGYGNGETTTNANSHVTVGGTTYQNISGDLVLDGAVVKGDHMSGQIDGAILAKSRPDTATYTGKQTNAGVSADIGFDGVPQSVSVNAGRSKVNADYAAVKEQTGIAMNSSDVVVAKASRFDGAYFTTATPEDNQTVFKEGVTTTDIQNHMNYKGDAINVGLGAGINPETQKVSPPGISGIGYGKDSDSQTSTTYGAVTGMAGKSDVTTATVSSLNKPLENSFDKTAVEAQLGAQVQVSQAFDTERRTYRLEMAREQQKTVEEAKKHPVGSAEYNRLMDEANKQQEKMVLFDSITGAIYGPNTNGVTGYVARAVAPEVSFRIGQYFKENHGEGTAPHILAHGILAAAVSVATGNDPTTGALSAMGAETAAPIVAKFLFGDKPISELTADEKATVSSITSLAGLGVGATTGDVGSAVSAGQVAQVAVDDNKVNRKQAGTVTGFVNFFNNTKSKMGQAKGEDAIVAIKRLNDTEWFTPTVTPPFNLISDRYIYTTKGGWIDMVHFLFYAGEAYSNKEKYGDTTKAINEAVQAGYQQERLDSIKSQHSTYSYEDLPTDRFGAIFGAKYFNPNSNLTFGEQVADYLYSELGATIPQFAPNYNELPKTDDGTHAGISNHTTQPLFIK